GIFAFSIVPIRVAALLGALAMLVSTVYVVFALYAKFFAHKSPQGFTGLIVAITFLSGMVLFFLGVIGEYVGRIYEETKGRPQYIIGRTAGRFSGEAGDRDGATQTREAEIERGPCHQLALQSRKPPVQLK